MNPALSLSQGSMMIDIGSRREQLVDDHLLDRLEDGDSLARPVV